MLFSIFRIPMTAAQKIESYAGFPMWSWAGYSSRNHLVIWEAYCRPKKGGLGLGNLVSKNKVLAGN